MIQCLFQDEERDRITYRGWDTSKEFLEQVVKEQGPFDGVMGFSQVQALQIVQLVVDGLFMIAYGCLHCNPT